MERETNQFRCIGEDGSTIVVVEHQHFDRQVTNGGVRTYPGARRYALSTGELVRGIDDRAYEVIDTGELLRRLD